MVTFYCTVQPPIYISVVERNGQRSSALFIYTLYIYLIKCTSGGLSPSGLRSTRSNISRLGLKLPESGDPSPRPCPEQAQSGVSPLHRSSLVEHALPQLRAGGRHGGARVDVEPPPVARAHVAPSWRGCSLGARSLAPSLARGCAACSLGRSVARSIAGSLDRSVDRSGARSLGRSRGRSIARSIARSLASKPHGQTSQSHV